jgi:predicted Zn-ribbon and HTH transcriptional regulator
MKYLDDFKEIVLFHLHFKCKKCDFEYENKDYCPRCGYKSIKEEEEIYHV